MFFISPLVFIVVVHILLKWYSATVCSSRTDFLCVQNLLIILCVPFPVVPQILPFTFGSEPINSGDFVMVNCAVVKGDSPLKITWLFSNGDLGTSGALITQPSERHSTLTVSSVLANNAGKYTCIASNSAGIANYTSHLKVNGIIFSRLIFIVSFMLWSEDLHVIVHIDLNVPVPPKMMPFAFGHDPFHAGQSATL